MTRRDFVQLVGAGLGGLHLTRGAALAKGGAPFGGSTPLPNAYRLTPIFDPGASRHGLDQIDGLTPGVMIDDSSRIVLWASVAGGGMGVFELRIDASGAAPSVLSARKLVQTGDPLDGGRSVARIVTGDTNARATFAAVLETDDGLPGVFLVPDGGAPRKLAGFLDPLPGGHGLFGGSFGDLDIADDDSLLLVGHYSEEDGVAVHQGLFHVPDAVAALGAPLAGRLLLKTGDALPQSGETIGQLGLLDAANDGRFAVQVSPRTRAHPKHDAVITTEPPALVLGSVHGGEGRLLSAPATLHGRKAPFAGAAEMGPRVGESGLVGFVLHEAESTHTLVLADASHEIAVFTSSTTPPPQEIKTLLADGNEVLGLSAPVLGDDGLAYVLAMVPDGMELWVTNGTQRATILSRGDSFAGRRVETIAHGFHPEQVDARGRIVFLVELSDGSSVLALGVPA